MPRRERREHPATARGPEQLLFSEAGGVTGIRRACEVRTAALSPALRRALAKVLAAKPAGPGPGRDLRTYRLTVSSAKGSAEVVLDETALPAGTGALIRYLSRRAAPLV